MYYKLFKLSIYFGYALFRGFRPILQDCSEAKALPFLGGKDFQLWPFSSISKEITSVASGWTENIHKWETCTWGTVCRQKLKGQQKHLLRQRLSAFDFVAGLVVGHRLITALLFLYGRVWPGTTTRHGFRIWTRFWSGNQGKGCINKCA